MRVVNENTITISRGRDKVDDVIIIDPVIFNSIPAV
jgi:hypothetical protein